jgi:PleD family two-component response regulator
MITGEEERTVMARAFQAGVEFFLFKPVAQGKQSVATVPPAINSCSQLIHDFLSPRIGELPPAKP